MKTSSSLTYVQMVLLPVLTALYDHLSVYEFGSDLLCKRQVWISNFGLVMTNDLFVKVDDIQVACYKILNNLFQLGTDANLCRDRYCDFSIRF